MIGSSMARAEKPAPTLENVPYGKDPQQVLDFYQAKSAKPTPLMFYIHGGGWQTGDKGKVDFLGQCLSSGISVVSINYRLLGTVGPEISPPVKACFDDTARALQFVRSKATEWKLDKTRVAAVGGSAGGYNSLWLAFHDDMADPKSADPIARESTRITCAFTFVPQTTLDPKQATEWIPGNKYGNHAFRLPTYQAFLDKREELMPFIKANSPYYMATPDDPPVFLFYDTVPALGTNNFKDLVHSANWGAPLSARLTELGVKHVFYYPGVAGGQPDLFGFIKSHLLAP